MTLFGRCWVLTSQAINALAFDGDPDESLSARCWRLRAFKGWGEMAQRIDKYLGAGHCQRAYDNQLAREAARKV
jgi:lysozyme family protein